MTQIYFPRLWMASGFFAFPLGDSLVEEKMESNEMVIELLKIAPPLLWILVVVVVLVMFYRPIRDDLLPKLSGLKAIGVEFSFIKDSIDAAADLGEGTPEWGIKVPQEDRERALNRARQHPDVFRGVSILWVDDHPENNRNERRMFNRLLAEVDVTTNTVDALKMTAGTRYDLVLSDMERDGDGKAGMDFLKRLREQDSAPPVIFYVGSFNGSLGVPGGAFGITDRPDELLHLMLDVLERRAFG